MWCGANRSNVFRVICLLRPVGWYLGKGGTTIDLVRCIFIDIALLRIFCELA